MFVVTLSLSLGALSTSLLASDAVYDAERQAIEVLAGGCAGCHGTDGQLDGLVPALSGRSAQELENQLIRFRNDEVFATVMNRIAGGFTEDELRRLAQHFSAIDPE